MENNLKALNLLFGSACNLHCGYCLQQDDMPRNNKKADVDEFLTKFKDFVATTNLTTKTVHYWGGEPMLYWNRIKKVYLGITPLFKARMHRITTNGTLITDDYVDFCNAHPDIFTVVSFHDGRITDDQWKRIVKLKNFSVENLIHHKQLDPRIREKDWRKICEFAGREIPFGFDFLKANNGCAPEYWLTEDDVTQYFRNIFDLFNETKTNDFAKVVISHFLYSFQKDLENKTKYGPPCVNTSVLSIDLFGNVYKCHHDNSPTNVVGNIFKKIIPITPRNMNHARYYYSAICKMCFAYRSCGGGCYLSNTHDVDCWYYGGRHQIAEYFLKEIEKSKNEVHP